MDDPIVKGGQGRTEEDVIGAARGLAYAFGFLSVVALLTGVALLGGAGALACAVYAVVTMGWMLYRDGYSEGEASRPFCEDYQRGIRFGKAMERERIKRELTDRLKGKTDE